MVHVVRIGRAFAKLNPYALDKRLVNPVGNIPNDVPLISSDARGVVCEISPSSLICDPSRVTFDVDVELAWISTFDAVDNTVISPVADTEIGAVVPVVDIRIVFEFAGVCIKISPWMDKTSVIGSVAEKYGPNPPTVICTPPDPPLMSTRPVVPERIETLPVIACSVNPIPANKSNATTDSIVTPATP